MLAECEGVVVSLPYLRGGAGFRRKEALVGCGAVVGLLVSWARGVRLSWAVVVMVVLWGVGAGTAGATPVGQITEFSAAAGLN